MQAKEGVLYQLFPLALDTPFCFGVIMRRVELERHHGRCGWLRSLGLEQYEAAFRENAIDLSVLPDLTDQDLEKLGVLLGHRRKLLDAR